jgi:hypothetical protein
MPTEELSNPTSLDDCAFGSTSITTDRRGYLHTCGSLDEEMTMRNLRRWGAVYILIVLFLGSWIGQFFAQMAHFTSDQEQHGQSFEWKDYLASFFASTFENWQSEWLQLIFQAVLLLAAKHLLFKADAEDLERIESKIDHIHEKVGAGKVSLDQEPGRGH